MTRRRYCVLLGNANTGIYSALRTVHERFGKGDVILPAITNPSVAQMVIYAELNPVFVDVDVPDCTIGLASLREKLSERTRAIIPIHIFGGAAPMAEVQAFARERNVAVLEDGAQALGGAIGGDPIGSFGNFSVMSFGADKIIGAGGGGVFATDDEEAAAHARALASALPPYAFDTRRELQSLSHRNLYHGLVDLMRVEPGTRVGGAFLPLVPSYRDLYLRSLSPSSPLVDRIGHGLDELPRNLAHRLELAQTYEAGLHPFEESLETTRAWHTSGVVWRFTFLTKEAGTALKLTTALRKAGIPASNHYWSAAELMYDVCLPNADYASRRLVNLWVDESTSSQDAARALSVIQSVLQRK